jgi:hypothetical protein
MSHSNSQWISQSAYQLPHQQITQPYQPTSGFAIL